MKKFLKFKYIRSLDNVASNQKFFLVPISYEDGDLDFPELPQEKAGNWSLATRCAQSAIAGGAKDQRSDKNCPNVLVINTDDMAWGDVSLNNPSKLIPTPNLDRLVSKGINFRDGHACTARCAPSRTDF